MSSTETLYDVCNDYSLDSDTRETLEQALKNPSYRWFKRERGIGEDIGYRENHIVKMGYNEHDELVLLIGPNNLNGLYL